MTFLSRLVLVLLLCSGSALAQAQEPDTARKADPIRNIQLQNVDVAPGAVDTKGWLLLDKDIQIELGGAVENLYNFKFDKAERQFRSLRRRYPNHPMPYFLLGLSTWWKIVPTNVQTKQYDKLFFAYMDTAIVKGEKLYEQDNKNYEACFFLSAAYGFDARLNAERKNWRKATVSSKRSLDYLEKSKEANGLSPEFLFGQALFNYYAVWISEEYPLLRPVLLFFPKGNRKLGLQQLRNVADNGFYTGAEAKTFLMRILTNEEDNSAAALPVARYLASTYPDNAYFQRFYALLCFHEGEFMELERVSREILDKLNRGMPGYEGISGRYATYFMGWLMQTKYKDMQKAQDYFQRCIVFSETTGDTEGGFYIYANVNLARMASKATDTATAVRYYKTVADKASHKTEQYREAVAYLKKHKK
ncbi:tol-pal system protein YbgF [Hymenobacter lutimineralis]|uniref:Tol-pal system protein YbgF n=1 Tax=Hymenobacter lutimineralis TaxID=2606448 RepID=A0A5D6V7D5_9BACT|nr:tol-pal system protein YbgF [Hymenobacter lutimineralis]TYZ11911.1 tol-pal system protein YbgF [Hymenobacter lutimineralis]